MKEPQTETETVRGERSSSTLRNAPSVQSRMSNILAIGLISVLGLGLLTWYYANALTRQSHARQNAESVSAKRAQGDMPLPSLGRIDPPAVERPALPPPARSRSTSMQDARNRIRFAASWFVRLIIYITKKEHCRNISRVDARWKKGLLNFLFLAKIISFVLFKAILAK